MDPAQLSSKYALYLRALLALVTLGDCRRRRRRQQERRRTKKKSAKNLFLPSLALSPSFAVLQEQVDRPTDLPRPLSISHPREEVRIRGYKEDDDEEEEEEEEGTRSKRPRRPLMR